MPTFSFTSLLLVGIILFASPLPAEATSLALSLAEAEQRALAASLAMLRSDAEIAATQQMLRAQKAVYWPRLSLEGNYHYLDKLPELALGPQELSMAQHHNYSIGPHLSYTLYQGGVDAKNSESLHHQLASRRAEKSGVQLKVLLATRQAYARVQAGIEELRLLDESLRLTQNRLNDMQQRLRAGSASNVDMLVLQREEDQLTLRYVQSQATLGEGVRQLASLCGIDDLPAPLRAHGNADKPSAKKIPPANLLLALDAMERSLGDLQHPLAEKPAGAHPTLAALSERSRALHLAAMSKEHEALPQVQVFASSTYQYPNGPLSEKIWQNSFGIALHLELYDGGRKKGLAAATRAEAEAVAAERAQRAKEHHDLWQNAEAGKNNLLLQREITLRSLATAQKEAALIETNYRAGAAIYLEVQRATTRVLEFRTALLRLKAEEIALLAMLQFLSAESSLPASAPSEKKP